MTGLWENDPGRPEPDETKAAITEPPQPPRVEPKASWLRWVVTAVAAAVLVIGGWFLISSLTVTKATHDNALADLEATSAQLSDVTAENQWLADDLAAVTADLEVEVASVASLQESVDTLDAENVTLTASLSAAQEVFDPLGQARLTALALTTKYLWVDNDWYAEVADSGARVALGDELVDMVGLPYSTWESFAGSNSAFRVLLALREVEEPSLDAAFER